MSMRLLKKQEITAAKAKEQHQAVAEGLKLAKKVDALREVSAQEEASLAQFRVKTLENIGKDIAAMEQVRDALVTEVQLLTGRREDALAPLDSYKKQLYEEALALEYREETLALKAVELDKRDYDLHHREFAATKKEHNNEVVHTQVEAMFQEASTLKGNAVKEAIKASELLRTAEAKAKVFEANALEREVWVKQREAAVANAEESNNARESELEKEWRLLNDRRALHERNLKRNK